MTSYLDRRRFVTACGVTAVAAAAAGVGGELLISKRFSVNTASVKLTAPVVKPKPLAKDVTLDIPGLSPFYTPNTEFYRVDTSLITPQVSPASWQLRIHGMVDNPMTSMT